MKAVTVLRKPLEGTVAQNCLTHGTGALNIDGCRVGTSKDVPSSFSDKSPQGAFSSGHPDNPGKDPNVGRWPSNVIIHERVVAEMDAQSGVSVSKRSAGRNGSDSAVTSYGLQREHDLPRGHNDTGGASRFFKQVKK